VELNKTLDEVRFADPVGPGDRERRLFGWVDALLSQTSERRELFTVAEPEFEAWRSEAQFVEGSEIQSNSLGLRR
jgi:3-hydroxymyristoyl/3-hydroxydecanoyl-(acyl carrier protein) dehydratase